MNEAASMTDRYRLDPARSQFTVHAFATGLLSFAGHSPTFSVRDFRGGLRFEDGQVPGMALDLTVAADSLKVLGQVRPSDRLEIEDRMRRHVLETTAYPEVVYQAADIAAEPIGRGRHRLRINGSLALHGVTRPHRIDAELQVFEDGVRLLGACPLRLSDYRIRPVSALGGTIKLKDDLRLDFNIAAVPEPT